MAYPRGGPGAEPTGYADVSRGAGWNELVCTYRPETALFSSWDQELAPGKRYVGGGVKAEVQSTRRDRMARRTGYGAVRALHSLRGATVSEYWTTDGSDGEVLTKASRRLFTDNREGHFLALDALTGQRLWRRHLGGQMVPAPVT